MIDLTKLMKLDEIALEITFPKKKKKIDHSNNDVCFFLKQFTPILRMKILHIEKHLPMVEFDHLKDKDADGGRKIKLLIQRITQRKIESQIVKHSYNQPMLIVELMIVFAQVLDLDHRCLMNHLVFSTKKQRQ
jgi:hypothetical protein